ncbi:hypothetical protein B566_EDAN004076 [Ephemera danica]|nr:hypothetical protein B566_EDAN004076 [Ephemera danica]
MFRTTPLVHRGPHTHRNLISIYIDKMRSAMVHLLATLALCFQLVPCVPAEAEMQSPSYVDEPTSNSDNSAPPVAAFRSLQKPSFNDQLFQVTEKRQAAQYCGRKLSDALHLVCRGRYNVPLYKKSAPDTPYWLVPPSPLEEEPIKFPFRPRSLAAAFMPGALRRRTRGAYDECCVKGCSLKEMLNYCGGR